MINKLTRTAHCPKCGGRVFVDHDHYGLYAQCLLCGHLQNLEDVPAVLVKTISAVSAQPPKKRRNKIKV